MAPSDPERRTDAWRTMFAETQDQQLFERTTARLLETHYPTGRVRALAGSESLLGMPREARADDGPFRKVPRG